MSNVKEVSSLLKCVVKCCNTDSVVAFASTSSWEVKVAPVF